MLNKIIKEYLRLRKIQNMGNGKKLFTPSEAWCYASANVESKHSAE